uniref:Uncharacterized protein n=1 Tax=Pseudictyota dubia TaxID=2749911 RepID=A0A7R9VFX4_9STRA
MSSTTVVEKKEGMMNDNSGGMMNGSNGSNNGNSMGGMNGMNSNERSPGNPIPVPSDLSPPDSSAANPSYTTPNIDAIEAEHMIVSGGFTDEDWDAFPIWSYQLAADSDGTQGSGWVDLSGITMGEEGDSPDAAGKKCGWYLDEQGQEWPAGRVGHLSVVREGVLHVFGGLTYESKRFEAEDGPYVWKADVGRRLEEARNAGKRKDGSQCSDLLEWEKVDPEVGVYEGDDDNKDVKNKANSADEQDVVPSSEEDNTDDSKGNNDQSNDPNANEDGDDSPATNNTDAFKSSEDAALKVLPSEPETEALRLLRSSLPRGECQGGHWPSGDRLILYGGLRVSHVPDPRHNSHRHSSNSAAGVNEYVQIDTPLGDVWAYDYEEDRWELMAPYPPHPWQRDEDGRYPRARTAHGATVVGDKLVIYGGMASSYEDDDPASFDGGGASSRPSNAFGAHSSSGGAGGAGGSWEDASSEWDALTDVWTFDLVTRKWEERGPIEPQLARSYHSLVGWGDGSVAAFGGFRTARTVAGDPIAFVFSDVILSRPPSTPTAVLRWMKAQWPQVYSAKTVPNRLEHTAVLDRFGSMYVWGGRFKTVGQLGDDVWKLDVFGGPVGSPEVRFAEAPPDGLDAYEAELEALHLLVAVMMFMSVLFTALYGTLRRQAEAARHTRELAGGGGGAQGS